ncbi:hypothetical protein V8C86DRAFT_2495052 [Haematococcus lacustris]
MALLPGAPVTVYCDGIFDMFHLGHARALEQAKQLFPNTRLLVGVCSDAVTHAYKGKTVMNEKERYESVRHCKWVDEVIEDAPWVITPDFLDRHNIDFVAHDDLPYPDTSGQAGVPGDVYAQVKQAGRFRATQRTEGISTSDLILRVLKDYNSYVLRNLQRGYTRKQLGISMVKEQRIRAGARLRKLQEQVQAHVASHLRAADGLRARIGIAKGGVKAKQHREGQGSTKVRRLNLADTLELKGRELADLIRRNGEDLLDNMEVVVDKVIHCQVGHELQAATSFLSNCVKSMEQGYKRLEQLALSPLTFGGVSVGRSLRLGRPRSLTT